MIKTACLKSSWLILNDLLIVENPTWNDVQWGYVVFEGDVALVELRYQGNTGGRLSGPGVPSWPFPGPPVDLKSK